MVSERTELIKALRLIIDEKAFQEQDTSLPEEETVIWEHTRKNWMTINAVRGAQASAVIYSITETARANGLNVYYIKYLLEQLAELIDDREIWNNQS